MEESIQIHLILLNKNSKEAISGIDYLVKFYDKDPLRDDFLGSSDLDDHGQAIINVRKSDFRSKDSPFEKYPDIYFELFYKEKLLYKSNVFKNLHLKEARDFPLAEGKHLSLGTFLIENEQIIQ